MTDDQNVLTNRIDVEPRALQRDRVTWTGYAMLATFGWFIYTLGPVVSQLRDEQGTSRTVASFHSVAFACGVVVAGLFADRVLQRIGRRRGMRLGVVLLVTGGSLLVAGSIPDGGTIIATVAATFIGGTGGALAVTAATAVLSDHHGNAGPSAVTEGNALATATGLLTPLLVGAGVAAGVTWRPSMLIIVVLGIGVWRLTSGSRDVAAYSPTERTGDNPRSATLPGEYWLVWIAVVACVMVETAFVTWTPDLLSDRTGLTGGSAAATTSAFLAGMTLGRVAISRLVLRFSPTTLFVVSLTTALLGWVLLWSTTITIVALIGLAVSGLGAGGQFPLGSVLLIDASDGQPDRALGLLAVGVGTASGAGPFVLGALADATSIRLAFIMTPTAIAVALVAARLAFRRSKRGRW